MSIKKSFLIVKQQKAQIKKQFNNSSETTNDANIQRF